MIAICSLWLPFVAGFVVLKGLTNSVPYHIETIQWICNANHFTDFCVLGNIGR